MIEQLKRQDFEQLAPGSLLVVHGEQMATLTVVEARDLPSPSQRQAPFAIVLEGPRDPFLPQAIHPIQHPVLGLLELFIVPIARDDLHTRYEVIFN